MASAAPPPIAQPDVATYSAKYDGDLGNPNVFSPLPRALVDRRIGLVLEHFQPQGNKHWLTPDLLRAIVRIRGMACVAPEGLAEAFYVRKLAFCPRSSRRSGARGPV